MSFKAVTIEADTGPLTEILERGEEGITARNKQSVAKPVLFSPTQQPRTFGAYTGKIRMTDDFAAPLPEDYWFGGIYADLSVSV